MAENGLTVALDSPLAGGLYGYTGLDSSLTNTAQGAIRYNEIRDGDVGNTILFPESAYASLVEPAIRFYKLRGYYAAGLMFETWVAQTVDTAPPSGHTLQNIAVVDTWII